MNDLVEQKLKKLHYFPPNFRVQPPHSIVAAHPLLAGIPKTSFRSEVRTQSMLTSHVCAGSSPPQPLIYSVNPRSRVQWVRCRRAEP